LPINLGVIQQMGEAFPPLVFGEEAKRCELGVDTGKSADNDRQPEVTGVAYEIDNVKVLDGWCDGFRHSVVYGAGVDFE
jgi:hypothetical protein